MVLVDSSVWIAHFRSAQAELALTEELAKRNQPRFPISIPIGSLGSFGKAKYERCGPDWEIRFYQDPNNELRAGELAVTSELTSRLSSAYQRRTYRMDSSARRMSVELGEPLALPSRF